MLDSQAQEESLNQRSSSHLKVSKDEPRELSPSWESRLWGACRTLKVTFKIPPLKASSAVQSASFVPFKLNKRQPFFFFGQIMQEALVQGGLEQVLGCLGKVSGASVEFRADALIGCFHFFFGVSAFR